MYWKAAAADQRVIMEIMQNQEDRRKKMMTNIVYIPFYTGETYTTKFRIFRFLIFTMNKWRTCDSSGFIRVIINVS